MKLRVERITEEPQSCAFSEPVEDVNRRLEGGGVHDFQLTTPLEVSITYYRAGDDLFFDGHLQAGAEGTCARCVESFALKIDVPFQFVLSAGEPSKPNERPELHAEDLSLSFYSGDEVDLSPLVDEQTILALPTRALCREDCRGLCPSCGANRNLDRCECRESSADPRLAVLRGLRVGRAS